MSEEPIHLRYRWTVDEALRAQHYHARHVLTRYYRPILRAGAATILAVGLGFAVLSFLDQRHEPEARGELLQGAIFLIVCGLLAFALPALRKWRLRRQYAQRPDRDCEVEWAVDGEGLTVHAPNSRGTFTWQAVMKIVETVEGFLVYRAPNVMQWPPRDAFASDADRQRFAAMARERVAKFYDET